MLLFFVGRFQTFSANLLPLSIDFFRLKIDLKFSQGFDVGMADLVTALGPSAADIAYSRHNVSVD